MMMSGIRAVDDNGLKIVLSIVKKLSAMGIHTQSSIIIIARTKLNKNPYSRIRKEFSILIIRLPLDNSFTRFINILVNGGKRYVFKKPNLDAISQTKNRITKHRITKHRIK
jgi:Fe2+ transport system protein FeoA